jgi:hypothetical protein
MNKVPQEQKQGTENQVQTLWIPGPMPSLNQLVGGKVRVRILLKAQWIDVVVAVAMLKRLRPMTRVRMYYEAYEKRGGEQGRDPLNIYAGAAKVIEDALVQARILSGDHQGVVKQIVFGPITHRPEKPGILLRMEEVLD